MAEDTKILDLAEASALSATCWFVVADTSDTTMDPSGTDLKLSVATLKGYLDTLYDAAGAAASVVPSQSGQAGKYLTTDGASVSWGAVAGGGGGGATTLSVDSRLTPYTLTNAYQHTSQYYSGWPAAGTSLTLLELASGSGAVTAVQMSVGHWGDSDDTQCHGRLRVYTDGNLAPEIDVDLGTLFLSHGDARSGSGQFVGTDNLQTSMLGGGLSPASYQLQFPIPYSDGVKVEIHSPAGTTVPSGNVIYSSVFHQPGPASTLRLRSVGKTYLDADAGDAVGPSADDVLFDIPSLSGWLVWHSRFAFGATDGTYNERPTDIYRDGDADGSPSVKFTGGEEFGASGWYYAMLGRGVQPAILLTACNGSNNQTCMGVDWLKMWAGIKFSSSVKVVVSNKPGNTPTTSHKMAWSFLYYTDSAGSHAPSAPRNLTATAGDGQASLAWERPWSQGSKGITGYTVSVSPGGAAHQVTADAVSYTVTGLTNGTAYTFGIHATNLSGDSGTVSSGSVTPQASSPTVPGAPTGVTATAGDASATVSFTPPGGDGGAAVTGYTATSTPGGLTATGVSSPLTVTGLTNGTSYTFTVHATNSVGNSAESAPSGAVTPQPAGGGVTVLVSDSFTRADSSSLGSTETGGKAWRVDSSSGLASGAVVSGAVQLTSTMHEAVVASVDTGVTDRSAEVTLAAIGQYPGYGNLMVRYADYGHYVYLQLNATASPPTAYQLVAYDGAYDVLLTAAVTPAAGDVLKVVATGNTYEVFINGTSYGTATSSVASSATRGGFSIMPESAGTYTVVFDDFKVTG